MLSEQSRDSNVSILLTNEDRMQEQAAEDVTICHLSEVSSVQTAASVWLAAAHVTQPSGLYAIQACLCPQRHCLHAGVRRAGAGSRGCDVLSLLRGVGRADSRVSVASQQPGRPSLQQGDLSAFVEVSVSSEVADSKQAGTRQIPSCHRGDFLCLGVSGVQPAASVWLPSSQAAHHSNKVTSAPIVEMSSLSGVAGSKQSESKQFPRYHHANMLHLVVSGMHTTDSV